MTCYQHAHNLFRDLGDPYHEADILTHLGDTHHAAGNARAAHDAWQHALAILTDLDHPDADTVHAKLAPRQTRPTPGPCPVTDRANTLDRILISGKRPAAAQRGGLLRLRRVQ
nr:tetratricopeptide repeat protein [Streptomyces tubercidicus]